MSGTRGGIGRVLAMGVALALALLLLAAGEARAAKYAVAQCGWYAGADAAWADTSGTKFRPDGFCVPGPPADPFAGSHLKSLTRDGAATVSGTRFARWRWTAPPATGITQVRGTWWHALQDGFEQRLGTDPGDGSFVAFGAAAGVDTAPREFAVGFPLPQLAFEDRLLCARGSDKWCAAEPGSWSALRALTITVEDDAVPTAALGGQLLGGGWHVGVQGLAFSATDLGAGVRFGETFLDGARVDVAEYPCAKASIGGEWRATQMQPCLSQVSAASSLDTARFSDGFHAIYHCAFDFGGNPGCSAPVAIAIDNNPPAQPRAVQLAGGDDWRRSDRFDLAWTNPDQGAASPIWGVYWRIQGAAGYDSGLRFAGGRDVAAIAGQTVPGPGAYTLRLWLRDEAGNASPAEAAEVPLRFDDVPPRLTFAGAEGEAIPERIVATVEDPLSGPASGQILYRRSDTERWLELPTKLMPAVAGRASLVAPLPDLAPGAYLFRVEAVDGAGNEATSTLRGDGTQMAIRKLAPVAVPKAKTRLFARLGGEGRSAGDSLTVPFAAPALLSGRLTDADGAGLAGRELRVVSHPSRGALQAATTATVRTGERGGFELRLPPAPSRRLSVTFAGDGGYLPAARPSLDLRVRSGVSLTAAPRELANGETVLLSGRVDDRAAPVPRRGKLVAIQYREEETGRWRPVLVVRTDHEGRFRARYRFRYVSAVAAIRLRATALAEERWPYAPGSSPPVTIRVGG